ncbi:MAG TPA: 2-oxo acid dehydrogenase subunit E2 [Acidobacteriota bacterium]|jgi:pyruvate dehydrogenase E2 component (dihydrolipoamide acetyltransferase)
MATELMLPELGENIDSGDVIKVLVSVGDTIKQEQAVIELETDKATIEVPSSVSGKIEEIFVKEGEKIKVGQKILAVGGAEQAEGEKKQTKEKRQDVPKEEHREKAEAKEKGEEETKAEDEEPEAEERKAKAEAKEQGEEETKAEDEEPEAEERKAKAEAKEKGQEQTKSEGRKPEAEERKAKVEAKGKEEEATRAEGEKPEAAESAKQEVVSFPRRVSEASKAPPDKSEAGAGKSGADVRQAVAFQRIAPAAPSVRRLAREIGVEINQVAGSGPDGRISIEDVKEHARRMNERGPAVSGQVPAKPLPDFAKWGEVERKPMSNIRRRTAEHMAFAWSTIPQVTQFDRADVTQLEMLRERFGKKVEAAGGKLTVTAILLKVAAAALKLFPQFNASLDVSQEEIIFKKYIHIGVAVDTDWGLLVPVIRDVDKKNILSLAVELSQIAERTRNRKIGVEEMQGGSFTITNLGGIGGTAFSPIVNSPEVAILGIARGEMGPVFIDGQFQPRLMLPLSLSYDHRLIDGADAARFLRWIASALEQPFLVALEG